MSSMKWLSQNGVSPLKKIAFSKEFTLIPSITDSSSEEVEDYEEKKQLEKPGQFDIWSSVVSKKDDDSSKSLPPPYVHPLVKRSTSCLSEKSLEICTESLGSETGSDGFSSYPPSETGDVEEERKEEDNHQTLLLPQQQSSAAAFDDVKCSYDAIAKKRPQYGSFPPPIPSLSRKDGGSVRIETHRDNGRLVLEAVLVPSVNNFLAQRQDGRLVLTFANTFDDEVMVEEEEIESFVDEENETQTDIIDEDEVEDMFCEMEQGPKLSSGAMNVHRLAVMMNKPIWLANRNPTWPKTFDEIVNFGDGIDEKVEPTTPPPPPCPRVSMLMPSTTAAESFNAYEYYWRRPNETMSSNAKAATFITPLAQQSHADKQLMLSKNQTANDQQQLLVLRGNNGGYFVPLLKGCRETRRSLIFLDPYCIATS